MSTDTEADSEERLEKLASFQSVILKKALSFPNVKRVVYSTCSIHNEENEKVGWPLAMVSSSLSKLLLHAVSLYLIKP